ncbi:hypothetical protein [Pseudoalteromonas aurantia]|uniref:Uncharacterized protein n=1 Tax=Pseudoalteromonas aurantia TaxID=43654 RepID=A0A5S3V2L2_9GAMM|nr:hypothetical protein [Pseudoalteromonas aurantia]TMO65056.1 hypothetical protein CWC19_17755 [Pseudoalteromonas aurantia]
MGSNTAKAAIKAAIGGKPPWLATIESASFLNHRILPARKALETRHSNEGADNNPFYTLLKMDLAIAL